MRLQHAATGFPPLFLALFCCASWPASAAEPSTTVETVHVDVLDSIPVIERRRYLEPYEDCRMVAVEQDAEGAVTPATATLLGAAIGGAVGSEVADDDNEKAGAVVGAILGAAIAHNVDRKKAEARAGQVVEREECVTVEREVQRDVVVGYDVTYEHEGVARTLRTSFAPGQSMGLRIRTTVTPLETRR